MTPYKGAYSQRNRYGNLAQNQSTLYSIRAVANNTSMGRVSVSGTASKITSQTKVTSQTSKNTGLTGQTATLQGYAPGTPIHIVATPNPGFRFVRWEGMPPAARWQSVATQSSLSFNAQCNLDIKAVFEAVPNNHQGSTTVTVNAQPNDATMGSVNPAEPKTIEKGNEIALTATNKAGYHFVRWDGVGNLAGSQDNTSETIRIRPQTDINAVAVFAKDDSRDPEDPNGGETPGGGGGSTGGDPFSPETPSAGGNAGSGIGALIRKYWWAIAAAVLLWYLNKEGKL